MSPTIDLVCHCPLTTGDACFPLPIEIVERILIQCHARDVVVFSRTCRLAHSMIFHSPNPNLLWRDIFLANFDDPSHATVPGRQILSSRFITLQSVNWGHEAFERLCAELACRSPNSNFPISRAIKVFISAIHQAPPLNRGERVTQSLNLEWLGKILATSNVLNSSSYVSYSELVLRAQLRAYIGLDFDQGRDEESTARLLERRKDSRLYVYDVRNYSGRHWGPFLDDGTVDWIHVEHLVNVLVMNFRHLPDNWPHISPPFGLKATQPYSTPDSGWGNAQDWAKVGGTWRRYVSYMDFRDLYAFNFEFNRQIDPTFFDCPLFREATRLLELKLHLVDKETSRFRYHLWPDKSMNIMNAKFPPIYFAGISNNYKGNQAVVEGVVHMTPDGTVRWQFSSTHPESARWCSDGAQIGNVASASGVVGVWTTEYRQKDDPVGPFWLWKVPEDYPVELMEYSR